MILKQVFQTVPLHQREQFAKELSEFITKKHSLPDVAIITAKDLTDHAYQDKPTEADIKELVKRLY